MESYGSFNVSMSTILEFPVRIDLFHELVDLVEICGEFSVDFEPDLEFRGASGEEFCQLWCDVVGEILECSNINANGS